jgi:3-oxoacyl-[acyl-carrier protein] reductase
MSDTTLYPDLKNKIVLVTGASRGIGRAIAQQLAVQGCHVVFNYRSNPDSAMAMAEELKKAGAAQVSALMFDVTDTAKMKTELDNFIATHGPITGLVNNAGISKDQLILRLKEEDVDQILDTNLKSAIMLCSILSRSFLKASDVSVINISSIVGLMGNASQVAYSASKAGLIGLTKSFAKELASRKVRCNAICPGFIETDMTNQLDDKVKEAYLSQVPLNRFGTAFEVANLVCFLLSKTSAYITGETIKIDGGLYI